MELEEHRATLREKRNGHAPNGNTIDDVLDLLDGVRQNGSGWVAFCPAHDDSRQRSLSITESESGRILLHCFTGCEGPVIREAITERGIDPWSLRPSNGTPRRRPEPTKPQPLSADRLVEWQANLLGSPETLGWLERERGWSREAIETAGVGFDGERVVFPIFDRTWALVNLLRYDPNPETRDEDRKTLSIEGRPRDLFPAPETLPVRERIYFVEGEGDAMRVLSCGLAAVGLPGAGTAGGIAPERFAGRDVVVCFDCDPAGRKAATKVAKKLSGFASSVRVLDLDPARDDGFDVTDRLTGVSATEGRELLGQLADTAEVFDDPHGLKHKWLSEFTPRSSRYLDYPLLMADTFHLVVGRSKQGKGTILANVAARVTRGELGEKTQVVWVGTEDSVEVDVLPRIIAAGGEPSKVAIIETWIQLPRDIERLGDKLAQLGDVGMVVIDPVGNHIQGKQDNSNSEIRDAIAPLNQFADTHRCMVFGVRHLSEKEMKDILAAVLGASSWLQVPRAVLAILRDPVEPTLYHVQPVLGNRLPPGTKGRLARITGVKLPELENEITQATWIGESNQDVNDLIAITPDKDASKSAVARDMVLDICDAEGEVLSTELDKRVADAVGCATKTVFNQRVELKKQGLLVFRDEIDPETHKKKWFSSRTNLPRDATDD